jgi:PhnB protein
MNDLTKFRVPAPGRRARDHEHRSNPGICEALEKDSGTNRSRGAEENDIHETTVLVWTDDFPRPERLSINRRVPQPMQLHTYLNYGGNCEQAFRFYEQHLGGKVTMMMRHGEQPDPANVAPEWKNAVLHARMTIGGTELMGADVLPERFQPMRSAYLSLTVQSIEEAERIYALLKESGQIFMPMEETFFASRFAMLRDRFGTSWMILGPRPDVA